MPTEVTDEGIDIEEGEEDEDEDGNADDDEDDEDDFDDEFTSEAQAPSALVFTAPPGQRGPTTQDLVQLREATLLFNSNTFKLSLDAFLPTLRPSESRKPALTAFLHKLRTHLLSIPSIRPTHPLQAQRLPELNGVKVPYPFPRPAQEVNWKVLFLPPVEVQVIGSWATNTSLSIPARGNKSKHGWAIDLGIVMPPEMWEKKDYLNGRAWAKRAFYAAVVAASISAGGLDVQAQFEAPGGDERLVRVVLKATHGPDAPLSSHFAIHIHLLFPSGSAFPFSIPHLSPSRSCFHMQASAFSLPTPLYNSLLVSLSLPLPLLVTIHQFTQDIPAYRDALALLRAWVSRRGFDRSSRTGERSVLGFEGRGAWWALLLGGCVQGWEEPEKRSLGVTAKARLARGMSSYQLFRGVLDFLQSWDPARPVFMKSRTTSNSNKSNFTVDEWTQHHQCVFVDPSGSCNLLSGVPRSSLLLLSHEASLAMRVLDGEAEDAFGALLLRDLGLPLTRFDAVLRVDISGALPITDLRPAQLDNASPANALVHSILAVVERGLSTRAKCVTILQSPLPSWDPTTDRPIPNSSIDIGILFNPGQFARLIDHGPLADDTAGAATWREFWGDKSELRRFKDGSIQESVVWDASSHEDRSNISSRLVVYILGRHFRIPESAITLFQPMLDEFIQLPGSAVQAITGEVPSAIGFSTVLQSYDQLVKELKAIEGFPLSLLNATAATEGLRYTSAFPPLKVDASRVASLPDCLRHIPAHEIILEFEASTRWPDDLVADQKIKLAFFEEIATKLKARIPDSVVHIVLDPPPALPIEDNCILEVIMPNGIAFHARIYHNRERTLLERVVGDRAATDKERRQAASVLQRFNERFIDKPRHHSAIATLHHKYAVFSQTVRLTKRWLAAHLLLPHVPVELIELLCAHLFLCPGPFSPPTCLLNGFLRVLHILSTWKWVQEPLMVPLYSSKDAEQGARVGFPKEKRDAVSEAFSVCRSADPSISTRAWFIATEEDLNGMAWGHNAPTALICRRITQLAKTYHDYAEASFEKDNLQMRTLFNPPYDEYDFTLTLDPGVLPNLYQGLKADESVWLGRMKFRNLPNQEPPIYGSILKADFDPALRFFRDLQRIYGDVCVLFYDPLGGEKIAGIWNPAVLKPTPFKVLLGFSSMPEAHSEDDGEANGPTNGAKKSKATVSLNKDAILNEMAALGSGLVKSVTTR
ncbi:Nrap protein [Dacryopinax primogenitus]|uniref:U3 small nucleolar RNA-associated protein 22 n=1 Tax=Dacryopinax primogenitus (strain DJM 731) TaxID=1858805 RepID=M5FRB7_DACPD|nr:Nrap protein [Dacryopinax primogenitus]EJT99650.1 Nrap protein [Dacryopinax primogenitus]